MDSNQTEVMKYSEDFRGTSTNTCPKNVPYINHKSFEILYRLESNMQNIKGIIKMHGITDIQALIAKGLGNVIILGIYSSILIMNVTAVVVQGELNGNACSLYSVRTILVTLIQSFF